MITNEQLDEIIKDCFIDLLDDLDLTYDFKIGVSDADGYGEFYDSKEELKLLFMDCETYQHSLRITFNLKDERLVDNDKVAFRNLIQDKFDTALEKFSISVNSFGYDEDSDTPHIYTQSQQFIYVCAFHKDIYEYLPIVIESKLVTKEK